MNSRLYYKPGTWLDGNPTLVYGDGDATVNRRSLEGCHHWRTLQKQKVFYEALPNVDHLAILRSNLTLQYVAELVQTDHPSAKEYVPKEPVPHDHWIKKMWSYFMKENNENMVDDGALYVNDV